MNQKHLGSKGFLWNYKFNTNNKWHIKQLIKLKTQDRKENTNMENKQLEEAHINCREDRGKPTRFNEWGKSLLLGKWAEAFLIYTNKQTIYNFNKGIIKKHNSKFIMRAVGILHVSLNSSHWCLSSGLFCLTVSWDLCSLCPGFFLQWPEMVCSFSHCHVSAAGRVQWWPPWLQE